MECPFCHAINTENSKFCGNCGKQLQVKCPRCGAMCIVSNKFCPQCGENINADIFWQNLKHYDGYRVYEEKTDCVILVKLNHRYTFIIPRVSIFPISNFEYEETCQTFFAIFWVKKNGKWGSINAMTGKQILDCVYDEIKWDWLSDSTRGALESYLSEERQGYPITACVKCDSKWGVVHVKGEHSIACSYDEIKYRSYGCYIIKQSNKYGYIKSWHLSISCTYDELRPPLYSPDCDYFIARINGRYGVIDVSEKIVVAFVYDMIEFAYSDDIYILKKNGYYGAYYRIKDKLIQCIYKTASDALKV